jgi:oligopeptide/dipeptide ABC transporter ATP-binding protein
MSSTSAAEVRDLKVWAGSPSAPVALVDDVSFEVPAGEVVGVVGETGAGKTLTMKAILGLLPRGLRASGHVRVGRGAAADISGTELTRAQALAQECGVVLQDPSAMLDPLVRVGGQLVEAVRWHGLLSASQARDRALSLLVAAGFEDAELVMRLYPHQLSGGMAQRAAIAMALMPKPTLLVVDEPTSALDASLRIEVLELIRKVATREGSSVLMVSHDLALISRFTASVLVMYAGRIVEQGATAHVLREARHPYTRALLDSATTLASPSRRELCTIEGQPPRPGGWPSGCVFQPRCPLAFERCVSERPALRPLADRAVACHLASRD